MNPAFLFVDLLEDFGPALNNAEIRALSFGNR